MDLKGARTALGWTQQQLADRAGVTQQTVSRLERGKTDRVMYSSVVRIVRTLRKAGLSGITQEALFPIPNGDDK